MRTLILAVAGLLSGAGLVVVAGAPPASAEPCHLEVRTDTFEDGTEIQTTVWVGDCASDENGNTVPVGEGTGSSGTGAGCADGAGKPIPCVTNDGVWFSSRLCYAKKASPQPPANDARWGSHKPKDGSFWTCGRYHTGGGAQPGLDTFFVPNGQEPAQQPVDPRVLAQRAFDQMTLKTPQIHTAPTPPDMTYVGLETWLWTEPEQYAPMSMTVTAGPTSVTVTAEPVELAWSMGDGQYVGCGSPGRAWVKGMSSTAETDCSHTYTTTSDKQPNDRFPVTARIDYQVDWDCSGLCLIDAGTLGEIEGPTNDGALRVGERQSVVISGRN